jgi:hypothetical protein
MDPVAIQVASIVVSGVIGLGGLGVALASAYWAHAARVEPFKKHLYDKQTQASTECVDALVRLQIAVEQHHAAIGRPDFFAKPSQIKSFTASTLEPASRLKEALYRWSPFLPYDVFAPIAHYISVVEYASNKRTVIEGWAGCGYPAASPWTFLPSYFLDAVAAVRQNLGIEPLGQQLTQTIGVDEKSRERQVAQKTQALGYLMSDDYRPYGAYFDGYRLASQVEAQ